MTTQNAVIQRLNFSKILFYGAAPPGIALVHDIFAALLPISCQNYLGLSGRWKKTAPNTSEDWSAVNGALLGFIQMMHAEKAVRVEQTGGGFVTV